MAEALFRDLLEHEKVEGFLSRSAGTHAWDGHGAHPLTRAVLQEVDLDHEAHASRPLSRDLVKSSHLVLAMDRSNLDVPCFRSQKNAHLLSEYASQGRWSFDVRDPIGGTLTDFRETRDQLMELLPAVLDRLREES